MAALLITALLVTGIDGSPWEPSAVVASAPAQRVATTCMSDPGWCSPPGETPWDRLPPGTHCQELLPYAMQAGIAPEDAAWYLNVAYGESHCQPDVRNSCCFGAMQIHYASWARLCGLTSGYDLYDPKATFDCALKVEAAAGRRQWSPHNTVTGLFPGQS